MSKRNGAPKSGTRRFYEAHKLPGGRMRPWGNSRPATGFRLHDASITPPTETMEVYAMSSRTNRRPSLFSRLFGSIARAMASFLPLVGLAFSPAIEVDTEGDQLATVGEILGGDDDILDDDNNAIADAYGAPMDNGEFAVSALEA